jgi:hypothetical protein
MNNFDQATILGFLNPSLWPAISRSEYSKSYGRQIRNYSSPWIFNHDKREVSSGHLASHHMMNAQNEFKASFLTAKVRHTNPQCDCIAPREVEK